MHHLRIALGVCFAFSCLMCFNLTVICIFCRRGHHEVFQLIQKRKLYPALVANLITLMHLGPSVSFSIHTYVHEHTFILNVRVYPNVNILLWYIRQLVDTLVWR